MGGEGSQPKPFPKAPGRRPGLLPETPSPAFMSVFHARTETGTKLTEMGLLQSPEQMVRGFSPQAERFGRTHVPVHVEVCRVMSHVVTGFSVLCAFKPECIAVIFVVTENHRFCIF